MFRKPLIWLLPLLLLWIIFGALFCRKCMTGIVGASDDDQTRTETTKTISNSTKTIAGTGALAATGLLIKDGSKTIATASKGNLIYGISGAEHSFETPQVENEFKKLAGHLKANPNKTIKLNGHYLSTEKNTSKLANLGLGRANSLKGYLVGLGVPASQILLGSSLKDKIATGNNKVFGAMDYVFGTKAVASKSININDGAKFKTGIDDNLVFAKNNYKYDKPISSKLKNVYTKTADYLKNNPNRGLKITGLYAADEKNNSVLPNLGLGRASDIKNILIGMGVASKQIDLDSRITEGMNFTNGKVVGPATYTFFDKAAPSNKLKQVEANLRIKPLTLYFKTGSNTINLSSEQRQYVSDLMYYMDNKEDAKVNITGHTDNVGDLTMNKNLSKRRAQFVKDYFAKNGINTTAISTIGMGPDQPVADNATAEGRAQNRRVEVTIK